MPRSISPQSPLALSKAVTDDVVRLVRFYVEGVVSELALWIASAKPMPPEAFRDFLVSAMPEPLRRLLLSAKDAKRRPLRAMPPTDVIRYDGNAVPDQRETQALRSDPITERPLKKAAIGLQPFESTQNTFRK